MRRKRAKKPKLKTSREKQGIERQNRAVQFINSGFDRSGSLLEAIQTATSDRNCTSGQLRYALHQLMKQGRIVYVRRTIAGTSKREGYWHVM